MSEEFHVNDEGTAIEFEIYDGDTGVDISLATVKTADFVAPSGAKTTKTLSFTTDGTDFLVRYLTEPAFLDEAGTWKAQAFVRLPSGAWYTTIVEFVVYPNL